MTDKAKYIWLTALALILSIIPPLIATVLQFPVWTQKSAEATVSGVVVFLSILCFVPLYKKIIQSLKSPSAPVMWTALAVFMYVMRSIAAEMFVVAVVGAISNIFGWIFFKKARKYKRRE